ncbi:hypothetical protein B0H65DRAFT_61426 [Neurospora tetraspora]|uniref:Uncharacterized protein n=1 Tax=Neurospora tetraspora TaxID=94610 RepID=A0AAE0JQJ8_9PEZI|nr:hypothetical protein B0H65DRAFT_61426 [Neurospora tetraspora]
MLVRRLGARATPKSSTRTAPRPPRQPPTLRKLYNSNRPAHIRNPIVRDGLTLRAYGVIAVYLRTTGSLDTYFKELKDIQDQFAQKLQPQFRPSLQLIQNGRGLEADVAGAGSRSDAKRHKTSARGDLHTTVDGMAANFNAQILAMREELDKLGSVREDLDRLTETMGDTLNRLTGVEAENRELKKQNYELKEYAVYFFKKNHDCGLTLRRPLPRHSTTISSVDASGPLPKEAVLLLQRTEAGGERFCRFAENNGELCDYQGPFKDRDAMRRHYKDSHRIVLGISLAMRSTISPAALIKSEVRPGR